MVVLALGVKPLALWASWLAYRMLRVALSYTGQPFQRLHEDHCEPLARAARGTSQKDTAAHLRSADLLEVVQELLVHKIAHVELPARTMPSTHQG